MGIVVLDGYCLNPGDLNWDVLKQFGELTVYDRTPVDLIVERAKNADVVMSNKTLLSAATLKQLPNLKFISVLATGYNIIDTEAAKSLGIRVANAPGYGTASVVQLCFALLLAVSVESPFWAGYHILIRRFFCSLVDDCIDAVRQSSTLFSVWGKPTRPSVSLSVGDLGLGKQTALKPMMYVIRQLFKTFFELS